MLYQYYPIVGYLSGLEHGNITYGHTSNILRKLRHSFLCDSLNIWKICRKTYEVYAVYATAQSLYCPIVNGTGKQILFQYYHSLKTND